MNRALPVYIIAAYLLIPERVRRSWSFGTSTGTLALCAALNGEGWSAFRYARIHIDNGKIPAWTGQIPPAV